MMDDTRASPSRHIASSVCSFRRRSCSSWEVTVFITSEKLQQFYN